MTMTRDLFGPFDASVEWHAACEAASHVTVFITT